MVLCPRIMGLSPEHLGRPDDLTAPLSPEECRPGDLVVYTGDPILMTASNHISSLQDKDGRTLHLPPSTRLTVCKQQFGDAEGKVTHKGLFDKVQVRCHFCLEATPTHDVACRCGACGHHWRVLDGGECTCPEDTPIEAGKQQCVVS